MTDATINRHLSRMETVTFHLLSSERLNEHLIAVKGASTPSSMVCKNFNFRANFRWIYSVSKL